MSKRLDILEQSLEKKSALLDDRISDLFNAVRSTNGQPLNDKKCGSKVFKQWEKLDKAVASAKAKIKKAETAIEREKARIRRVENCPAPAFIQKFIDLGEVVQWRKFPNRFFITGVKGGRIVWDEVPQRLTCSHLSEVPEDQRERFKTVYEALQQEMLATVPLKKVFPKSGPESLRIQAKALALNALDKFKPNFCSYSSIEYLQKGYVKYVYNLMRDLFQEKESDRSRRRGLEFGPTRTHYHCYRDLFKSLNLIQYFDNGEFGFNEKGIELNTYVMSQIENLQSQWRISA